MELKEIIDTWINQGYGDNCFWEGWPECPTPEDDLTPKMVAAELDTLRAELKRERAYYDQLHDSTISLHAENEQLRKEVGYIIEHLKMECYEAAMNTAKEALK